MAENKLFILADDLTGANDTAIQFVKNGFSAMVAIHDWFSPSVFSGYNIISINSDTRAMNAQDAYNAVRKLIQRLNAAKLEGTYYKKVDSVLRGNPGAELAAVMDELCISLAIVAPSFPANRSILEQGILKSGKTVPQASIDAVKIFADSMEKKAENIPLEITRQGHIKAAEYVLSRYDCGVQVFVADAVTNEDLAIISRIPAVVEKPLVLAGSGALANEAAQNTDMKRLTIERPAASEPSTPVLVICGTQQGETAIQIKTLSDKLSAPIVRFQTELVKKGQPEEAIKMALNEAKQSMKKNPNICIVAVDTLFRAEIPEGNVVWDKPANDTDSQAISAAIGKLTVNLTGAFCFPVMFSTGGDTSLEICKHLGVLGIQPMTEICPGIPIGKIVGGSCENRYIITKSGRFGDKDSLVEIMNYVDNPAIYRQVI